MARTFLHAVDDILEAIEGIEQAIAAKTFGDYCREWVLRHAIQRAIEIISEASRLIPDNVKATRPEIPWVQVAAIGNVLRHEYHALSDRIIWNVVIDELPKLKIAILSIRDASDC
ncbi:MAG: HepT-like ribonuclease domain-containing protein [Methylovirgula sp.]